MKWNVEGNGISFPVAISRDAAAFKKLNKITGVPMTMLREKSGRISRLWLGRLDDEKAIDVERSASVDPIGAK